MRFYPVSILFEVLLHVPKKEKRKNYVAPKLSIAALMLTFNGRFAYYVVLYTHQIQDMA